MNNPFVLTYGKKPIHYLGREKERDEIIKSFIQTPSSIQTYLITGVRGSGKTALLGDVMSYFDKQDDWIVINLNPERDLINSLATQLYNKGKNIKLFLSLNITLSIGGISISIGKKNINYDVESIIELLFEEVKKKNKKVLIGIDEVNSNKDIKVFVHTFQNMLIKEMPIYLLMTGLYENIHTLEDNKSLTFLYRSPKIYLNPIDLISISSTYASIFKINSNASNELAKLTNGYAFAFQLLGYILFESKTTKVNKDILKKYDDYLREFAYMKIWESLSETSKTIIDKISLKEEMSCFDLCKELDMSRSTFSSFRERLIKRGLIYSSSYGYLKLSLPRFDKFIEDITSFEF